MKKLKVAVIGCGIISGMHLDAIQALDMAELAAVCDIREDKAKEAAAKYGGKIYTDYREMFWKEHLDVVHICLPHYLHTIVARDALEAGIHVLSEKPMSIQYEDAVKTVELAEEYGLQYGVIFQCRYNTPSVHIKKRIADGSGTKVQDVNQFLKSFEQMQKLMKQFSNPKKMKRAMGGFGNFLG